MKEIYWRYTTRPLAKKKYPYTISGCFGIGESGVITAEEFDLVKQMIAKPAIAILYKDHKALNTVARFILCNKCKLKRGNRKEHDNIPWLKPKNNG